MLLSVFLEEVRVALVGGAAAVPEEEPLQRVGALERVREAQLVLLVELLLEVQQLGAGLHDRDGGLLGVVDEDGDAPVRVQAQEPLLLLLVGGDVAGGKEGQESVR